MDPFSDIEWGSGTEKEGAVHVAAIRAEWACGLGRGDSKKSNSKRGDTGLTHVLPRM